MNRLPLAALATAALLLIVGHPLPATAAGLIVIGHRGASAERPEHTAASYRLAIEEGADFIEPDLVSTRDGVLIVRHENEIGATTDVAEHPEFADRRTTKTIDGEQVTGWFSEDFTLAEIRTLRARERLPELRPANTAFRDEPILTFDEVAALARDEGRRAGRTIGVYVELKHPTYFAGIGLPLEPRLVAALRAQGLATRDAPVVVQCFETAALKTVRRDLPVRTTLLIDEAGAPADFVAAGDRRTYADLLTPKGLEAVAAYADGIGPAKALIFPLKADGTPLPPTTLVQDAHAAGLVVHPWTLRPENQFLPADLRRGDATAAAYPRLHGDMVAEARRFIAQGVDGLFSDWPAGVVAARGSR